MNIKLLQILLLLPLLGWVQDIGKTPYNERVWYNFSQSDYSINMIDIPEERVIDSIPFQVVVHGNTTYSLFKKIDSLINYKQVYKEDSWITPLKHSMGYFYDSIPNIVISEVWGDEEVDCECVNHLFIELFDSENIIYEDITLGDLLMSDRLKEYGLVFYNTVNKKTDSVTYRHELVVYYKLKWNPLNKKERKTRVGSYTISFKEFN